MRHAAKIAHIIIVWPWFLISIFSSLPQRHAMPKKKKCDFASGNPETDVTGPGFPWIWQYTACRIPRIRISSLTRELPLLQSGATLPTGHAHKALFTPSTHTPVLHRTPMQSSMFSSQLEPLKPTAPTYVYIVTPKNLMECSVLALALGCRADFIHFYPGNRQAYRSGTDTGSHPLGAQYTWLHFGIGCLPLCSSHGRTGSHLQQTLKVHRDYHQHPRLL